MQARKSLLNSKTNLYEDWFFTDKFWSSIAELREITHQWKTASFVRQFRVSFGKPLIFKYEKLIETSALISTGKI